jgi:hypothetical protein
MLIPIGSWCRTAYQVNEFLKSHGVMPTSFPYDWTITSFAALKLTLDARFTPSSALELDNLEINQFGSITDMRTQLIHHHDFAPPTLHELKQMGESNSNGIPKALWDTDLIDKAIGRFCHTYLHLEALKNSSRKISFVRWHRLGHPDHQLPQAFEGESIANIAQVITNFLMHDNFSILTVKSQYINGELPEETIAKYERSEYGVSSTIIERKGFNGDGTKSFKGDTVVWHKLLNKFVEDENLTLS